MSEATLTCAVGCLGPLYGPQACKRKAPCVSAPLFFHLKMVCFLEAEHNLWVMIFSQMPAHRWEGLVMFPLCQQRGRYKFKLSEEHALQALASSSEVLVRCSYKILLASHPGFSLRVHSFIHSWVCQQVIVSACDPPEDHTSYVEALKWAMTFSSFECCRNDLSAGYLLM